MRGRTTGARGWATCAPAAPDRHRGSGSAAGSAPGRRPPSRGTRRYPVGSRRRERAAGSDAEVERLVDYWTPLVVRALAAAGVFAAFGEQARDPADVARETGVHAATLRRCLRVAATRGVVADAGDGHVRLTQLGLRLVPGRPGSLAGLANLKSFELHAWSQVEHALATGRPTFPLVHDGLALFDWLARTRTARRSSTRPCASARRRCSPPACREWHGRTRAPSSTSAAAPATCSSCPALTSRTARRRVRPPARRGRCPCAARGGRTHRPRRARRRIVLRRDPRRVAISTCCRTSSTTRRTPTPSRSCGASGRRSRRAAVCVCSRPCSATTPADSLRSSTSTCWSCSAPRERTEDEWRALLADGGFRLGAVTPTPGFAWIDAVPD